MKFFGYLGNDFVNEKIPGDLIHGYQSDWERYNFSHSNLHITFATLENENIFFSENVVIFFDGELYDFNDSKKE